MENKTTRTNKNDLFKINWSEKVMQLDETIRKEIGIDGINDAKNILIKVQTKISRVY